MYCLTQVNFCKIVNFTIKECSDRCRYIKCVILIKGENMVEFDGNVSGRKSVNSNNTSGYGQEQITEEIAKKILIDFKKKDTDASMRVSFEELSNAIIKEYVDNGYKRTDTHNQGETITDLLNYYQERAKAFDANGDGALNIDEYTAMFREKFEEAEKATKKSLKKMKLDPETRAQADALAKQQKENYNNLTSETQPLNSIRKLEIDPKALIQIKEEMKKHADAPGN